MSMPLIIIVSLVIGFLVGAFVSIKKHPQPTTEPSVAEEELPPAINPRQQEENEALKQKIITLQQTLEQEQTHAAAYRRDMQAYLQKVNTAVDNLCAAVDNIRHTVTATPASSKQAATEIAAPDNTNKDLSQTDTPTEEIQGIVKEEEKSDSQSESTSQAEQKNTETDLEKTTENPGVPPVDNLVDNSDSSLSGESPQESIKRHLDQSKHR